MKDELYLRVAKKYLTRYYELNRHAKSGDCLFKDVASNLVAALKGGALELLEGNRDETTRETIKKGFVLGLRAVRDYFRMLEGSPEFFRDEMAGIKGHFPELLDKAYSLESRGEQIKLFGHAPNVHLHYVYLAKKRLEEIAGGN
jgi:hypothetical protein